MPEAITDICFVQPLGSAQWRQRAGIQVGHRVRDLDVLGNVHKADIIDLKC